MSVRVSTPWGVTPLDKERRGSGHASLQPLPAAPRRLELSEAMLVLVAAVAAHDRLAPEVLIQRLVADRACAIGLGRLARSVACWPEVEARAQAPP